MIFNTWTGKNISVPLLAIAVSLSGCSMETGSGEKALPASSSSPPPNILMIVADDMGYSDLGSFGGEIRTPNLDALAAGGVRLTNFYAAPTCSPSRAMILTGVDAHLAGLSTMAERLTPAHAGKPGYEGYLNHDVAPVSEILQAAGYHTYMTGKWHLGYTDETSPAARGFDRSFALMDGGAFHLRDFPQLDPNKSEKPGAHYREDGRDAKIPRDFYSTRFYAEKMIDYIEADRDSGRPFFAYLAFTAPHFPLQVPESSRAAPPGLPDSGQIYVSAPARGGGHSA